MLTAKQSRFVDEYMVDLNGTQAAIRSGYSEKTARAIASENLKKPLIAEEIARRKNVVKHKLEGMELATVEALMRIAISNIVGIFGEDGRVKPPEEWPSEAFDAIKSFSYRETPGPFDLRTGKRTRKNYRVAIKSHEKLKALSLLGEHAGLFTPRLGRRPVVGR